nr:heavy metal-associated isoprenylated plant protein 32 [Quercus suber]
MEPSSYMTCALRVDTQTPGWHKSMIKVLGSIQGVSYTFDVQEGLAYVSGNVDPGMLLTMLAKAGKHTELCWVDSRYRRKKPIVQGDGYHDDHGTNQYATLGYDYGNTQYAALGYDHGTTQYATLGYDYGNNQPARLGYYEDDPYKSYPHEHNPHSEMMALPSPHATPRPQPQPQPSAPVVLKHRGEKPVNCCMM